MKLLSPAKLNRFLAILGRRPDGFHAMELVTTVLSDVSDLMDTLEAQPAAAFSLRLTGHASVGLSAGEDNLVVRAWRLLEKAAGRELPAALVLDKHIPAGGGLGGGSSNAATALKLGNALFQLGLPESQLLAFAAELGSDVPLFVLGGTVLGLDRGERVFPVRELPLEPMILVHPGLHVPTPSVFKALAAVGYPPVAPCPSLQASQTPPWRNDLTEASIHVCPELAEVRKALVESGGEPLLCGSGSCWVARFEHPSDRNMAFERLRGAHPAWRLWKV